MKKPNRNWKKRVNFASAVNALVCFVFFLCGMRVIAQGTNKPTLIVETNQPALTVKTNKNDINERLIESLKNIPVEGPSMGPPVHALSPNSTTEAIVSKGPAITPALISTLDRSSYTQTVWIVFCLKDMRAVEAKSRILKLQDEFDNGRFANEGHDLTLIALIYGYLNVISEPQSVTNNISK